MILIIGLGNPEEKYNLTRHNIGFRVLNEFQKENDFPDFKLSKKFNSLISEKKVKEEKVILAKPQTFMNMSGKAASALLSYFHLPVSSLFVVHDDIDLPFGEIKIAKNRGSAGHNGVESVIKNLAVKDFTRLRVGIKPTSGNRKQGLEKFVLEKFSATEEKAVGKILKKTCLALKNILGEGIGKTMEKFNKRI